MDKNDLILGIAFVVLVICIAFSVTAIKIHQDYRIGKAIECGADPEEVRQAFKGRKNRVSGEDALLKKQTSN